MTPPIRACPGRLFNHYNDGGYLIWFVPERKVFIDSRQDPYPAEVMRAHDLPEASGNYQPLFAQYKIGCAVVRPGSRPAQAIGRSYPIQYQDGDWQVFNVARPGPR